jgi:hypothetical protein
VSVAGVEAGFSLFLVLAALAPIGALADPLRPASIGVLAVPAGIALLLTRWIRTPHRRVGRRFALYLATLLAVYVLQSTEPASRLVQPWLLDALTLSLIVCLVVAIRVTRRSRFSTTPLDILILVFIVVALLAGDGPPADPDLPPLLPGFDMDAAVARLAVLFYATELLCSKGNRYINVMSVTAGLSLLAIGVRVLHAAGAA